MPDKKKAKIKPWSAPDLLDFEFFLNLDSDKPAAEADERDRRFAAAEIAPAMGESLRPDAPPKIRSKAYRKWLSCRREEAGRKLEVGAFSPGEAFHQARMMVGSILGILALAGGATLAWGLMNQEWRYYNVLFFLALTIMPQLVLIALMTLGWFFRRVIGQSAPMGFVQLLAQMGINSLSRKAWANRAGEKAAAQWRKLRRRPYLLWPVASLTQSAGVLFNVGLLAGFIGSLLVLDVRFFWESTPAVSATETLHRIVELFAMPWSWAFPEFVPTVDQINDTKIALTGAERGIPETADSAPIWAPFLIATIATWGLLPRLLLRILTGILGRKSRSAYAFNERPHRELWRRLTELHIEAPIDGPGDDAVMILWGGVQPDPGELRRASLQNLRLNPATILNAGGMEVSEDRAAIEETGEILRREKNAERVVLLAESWGLVPKDLSPFLKSLREAIGEKTPIVCFLTGVPTASGGIFSAPDAEEVALWEEFLADLGDASITARPYAGRHGDLK
jgi:hypothetical protein